MKKIIKVFTLIVILFITITLVGCGEKKKNEKKINETINLLGIPTYTQASLDLKTELNGVQISWETNEPLVMEPTGKIYCYQEPKNVELTATLSYNGTILVKKFPITVDASYLFNKFQNAWNTYNEYIPSTTIKEVKLPKESYNLCTITYVSSDETIMTSDGKVNQTLEDQTITMYCYLYREDLEMEAIFSKEITVLGFTQQQKIDMIKPYVDEQVQLFVNGEIDKLPNTHPVFGGTINWHSLETGFVSTEGYVSMPLTPKNIHLTATIRYNSDFLDREYDLENIGGNTTPEQALQSWLKFILPERIQGTYTAVKETDEFLYQTRTEAGGILNLIDGKDISQFIDKTYYIDETDTESIKTQTYGSSKFGLYHPEVPQSILNAYFYEGYKMPNENNILWITVHESGMPRVGQDAKLLAEMQWRYTHNENGRSASWHYQVDDKKIYQSYNDDLICWHASDGSGAVGGGNCNSIGIEMCINQDGNYEAAMRNDAKLIAYLMVKYNLKVENIKRHYDFAPDKKKCPNYMIMTGRWLEFLNLINYEYTALLYLQNATVTWEVTTENNSNTQAVLEQYFTNVSNTLWVAKPVQEEVKINLKVTVEKDGKTYKETSVLVLYPTKEEEE